MKFLEHTRKPKVMYTDNSLEILASLVKNYPGIIVRQRHTDQKHIGLHKEECAEERRNICGAVAVRSGPGFCGVSLLSAKHSRSRV